MTPEAAIGSWRGRIAAVKCRLSRNQAGNPTTRDEIVIEGGSREERQNASSGDEFGRDRMVEFRQCARRVVLLLKMTAWNED